MRNVTICALVALALAGCETFQNDAQRSHDQIGAWTVPALVTTGDVRMVMQRPSPLGSDTQIVCTEPSPDVAKAISTIVEASLKGQGPGGAGGGASLGAGSAEAVAELAGRTTAVLGLRDGLYKACEAYANGIIGDDAYALVLSRYGQLMVTLFLGQDAAAAAAQAGAQAQSPVISLNLPSDSGQGGSPPKGAAPVAPPAHPPTGVPTPPDARPAIAHAVADPPPAGPKTPATGQSQTPPTGGGSTQAAQALEQMQKNYLDLDTNSTHLLITACINEYDATRLRIAENRTNPWVRQMCSELQSPITLAVLIAAEHADLNTLRALAKSLPPGW